MMVQFGIAGFVLLAFGDVPLPDEPLTGYTDRTITDRRTLAREVQRCRSLGWAAAVREREVVRLARSKRDRL